MRKIFVMAGLLAAASAIPAMAQDWRNGRGGVDAGMQAQSERMDNAPRGERPQRNFEARGPRPAQAQAQVQAPAQAQAQVRGDWQGRRGDGGQWQGRRAFGGPMDAAAAQA